MLCVLIFLLPPTLSSTLMAKRIAQKTTGFDTAAAKERRRKHGVVVQGLIMKRLSQQLAAPAVRNTAGLPTVMVSFLCGHLFVLHVYINNVCCAVDSPLPFPSPLPASDTAFRISTRRSWPSAQAVAAYLFTMHTRFLSFFISFLSFLSLLSSLPFFPPFLSSLPFLFELLLFELLHR